MPKDYIKIRRRLKTNSIADVSDTIIARAQQLFYLMGSKFTSILKSDPTLKPFCTIKTKGEPQVEKYCGKGAVVLAHDAVAFL